MNWYANRSMRWRRDRLLLAHVVPWRTPVRIRAGRHEFLEWFHPHDGIDLGSCPYLTLKHTAHGGLRRHRPRGHHR